MYVYFAVNNDDGTTLHITTRWGHLGDCRLIIEEIEDKNPVNNNGQTPRDRAVMWGHIDVVQLFDS